MEMLSGEQLGAALTQAMELKNVGPTEVANHFGIKPPSVKDWQRKGCIHKKHLGRLVAYFSDVVSPAHWGVQQLEAQALASAWSTHSNKGADQTSAISTGDGQIRPPSLGENFAAWTISSESGKPSLSFGNPFGTSVITAPVVAWAELEAVLMKPNREWPGGAFFTSVAIATKVSDQVKFATVVDSRLPQSARAIWSQSTRKRSHTTGALSSPGCRTESQLFTDTGHWPAEAGKPSCPTSHRLSQLGTAWSCLVVSCP